MITLAWLKRPRFYFLLLAAVATGALVGALTSTFWVVLYAGIDFVWETIPETLGFDHQVWWYIALVVIGGSLLVGLCQHYLGDHPKEMKSEIKAFRAHGRFDTAHIPQGMVTSFFSLAAGASLGPEAPLFGLGGGLSSLAADRLHQFSGGDATLWTKASKRVLLVASLVAGGFAFVRVAILGGVLGAGGMFDAEAYHFAWEHLLWAIPASLIGVVAGYVFLALYRQAQRRGDALRSTPVRRALAGGVVFAVIAMAFPLTLFSGQHNLLELQTHALEMTGWTLLLAGLLKIAAVSVLLNTGWKGGTFLPLMTAAAMLGLLLSLANPDVPTLVPMVAAMTAIAAITLDNIPIVFILMLLLAPISAIGIYAVALVVSAAAARLAGRIGQRSFSLSRLATNPANETS